MAYNASLGKPDALKAVVAMGMMPLMWMARVSLLITAELPIWLMGATMSWIKELVTVNGGGFRRKNELLYAFEGVKSSFLRRKPPRPSTMRSLVQIIVAPMSQMVSSAVMSKVKTREPSNEMSGITPMATTAEHTLVIMPGVARRETARTPVPGDVGYAIARLQVR